MKYHFLALTILSLFICGCQIVTSSGKTIRKFKDPRDKKVYPYKEIEGSYWMTENMQYNIEGSKLNPDNPSPNYGRLYNWPQAMKACPEGWHLTSDYDWFSIEGLLVTNVDSLFEVRKYRGSNVKILKSKEGWSSPGTDSLKLNILPAGHASPYKFLSLGQSALFWTSTNQSWRGVINEKWAYYRVISEDEKGIFYSSQVKPNHYYSCRCVKIKEQPAKE